MSKGHHFIPFTFHTKIASAAPNYLHFNLVERAPRWRGYHTASTERGQDSQVSQEAEGRLGRECERNDCGRGFVLRSRQTNTRTLTAPTDEFVEE